MGYTERHIIETYTGLFSSLSAMSKLKLIENLSASLKIEENNIDSNFFKSFGAFESNETPEEIIKGIKSSRKFRTKEIKL